MSVIPVGYLTLFEAAERLREVRCKIAGPEPSNKEQFGAWYAKRSSLIDAANSELQNALETEALEAVVYDRERNKRFRITPDDVRENESTFSLLLYEKKISALWSEPLSRHIGEVPLVKKKKFARWFEFVTGEPWKTDDSGPSLQATSPTSTDDPQDTPKRGAIETGVASYRSMQAADEPYVKEVLSLIATEKISLHAATMAVAGRMTGKQAIATVESRARRLARRIKPPK